MKFAIAFILAAVIGQSAHAAGDIKQFFGRFKPNQSGCTIYLADMYSRVYIYPTRGVSNEITIQLFGDESRLDTIRIGKEKNLNPTFGSSQVKWIVTEGKIVGAKVIQTVTYINGNGTVGSTEVTTLERRQNSVRYSTQRAIGTAQQESESCEVVRN